MKYCILILALLTSSGTLFSNDQAPAEWEYYSHWNGSVSIYVNLNARNRNFIIEYEFRLSTDMISSRVISSGVYKQSGNEITFEDALSGMKMKALKNGHYIEFVSGYAILENIKFEYEGGAVSDFTDFGYLTNIQQVKTKRASLYKEQSALLKEGDYFGNSWFILILRKDKFEYRLHNNVIIQGTWSQKGNLITLHDDHTGHDFYLIYEEPNLRTMLLPGDRRIEGTVLKRQ